MKQIPLLLIFFRLLLAPFILCIAYFYGHDFKILIMVLMYLGLFSDIFDGIIARDIGVSSAKLRRMDSQVDVAFWLSIGVSSCLLFPEVIDKNFYYVYAVLGMELLCDIISFLRFKKETCYHALLAKLWGLSLLFTFTCLIGFGFAGFPFKLAIILGLVSHIDRILITLILPVWTHDVPSAYHAFFN